MSKRVIALASLIILTLVAIYVVAESGYFSGIHDVAIVSVDLSKDEAYIGDIVDVMIAARNKGSRVETFNVSSYYNDTIIGTQTISGVVPGNMVNLTFAWNTTGIPPANYIIRVEASTVPGETNTSDNMFLDGIILVRAPPEEMATISVDPSISAAEVNQFFPVRVNISSISDLYGWQFRLTWNSTLLDFANVTEGIFLRQGGTTFFTFVKNDTEGFVKVLCSFTGAVPGASGSGTLATVYLRVKEQGNCILTLSETALENSFEQAMNHVAIGGSFGSAP